MTIIKLVQTTVRQSFCLVMAAMVLIVLVGAGPLQAATITINELLADPGNNLAGDANGDGVRNSSDDEFIELVNSSNSAIDLTGWTISDLTGVRHLFPSGTIIDPYTAIVVFGGGSPTGVFGGSIVQTASTGGLSLNNTSETVTINDGAVDVVTISYGGEAGSDQSITLDPDISGASFVKHSLAAGSEGALFSPGTMIDGTPFSATVPVPGAVVLLGSGLAMVIGLRRKQQG